MKNDSLRNMRFVVARRIGGRGAGLGNESIPWAKGFIASQVLGARQIGPSWGVNLRKYYRNFGTSRLDFVVEEIVRRLPHHTFTDKEYDATGEPDFGRAIEQWAREKGLFEKRSFVVVIEGMYWGFPAVANGRPFLQAKFLNSRDTLRNMYQVMSRLDSQKLFVAVHIRAGDFTPFVEGQETRGKSNFRIPHGWYLRVCESLKELFGEMIQFYFFTDHGGAEFEEAVRLFNPGQVQLRGLTDCSDVLLMAHADLRVCSISSYSLVSSFLSDGTYAWYEPQWLLEDEFYQSSRLNSGRAIQDSLTDSSREVMSGMSEDEMPEVIRSWPIGAEGRIPAGLAVRLKRQLLNKSRYGNLLEHGAVPRSVL